MPDQLTTLLKEVHDYASQKAIRDLLDSGVDVNFLDELVDIFKQGVLTGSGKADLIKEFEKYLIGDEKKLGKLERYVRQVRSDAVTQYVANYTEVMTEDLGLEFYQYIGNLQDDTRCFCRERANNFYHYKEIEAWGRMDDLGECATGNGWAGMIEGTNASSIFTYRGGWNCEHQFVPVLTTSVERGALERNIENGNYDPPQEIRDYLGL